MATCGKCKQIVNRNKSIQCSACTHIFHIAITCSNTELEDITYLKNEHKLKEWKCPDCIANRRKSIADFQPKNVDLENESYTTISEPIATTSLSPADLEAIGLVVMSKINSVLPPNFKTEFNDLKKAVEFISDEYDNFKQELHENKQEVQELKNELKNQKTENSNLKNEIISLQNYSRRDNIVIQGINVTPNEAVSAIFNEMSAAIGSTLKFENLSTAHRIPSRANGAIKPIVFKTASLQEPQYPGISTKRINKNLPEGRVQVHQQLAPGFAALLARTKRLARDKGYRFIWVREDKILVKRDESSMNIIVIRSDQDVNKL
ncbi:hypothetical protein RI129_007184 [Pyrocoelia pectoralis]|uniref:FP protein C-terminal domain-containing protein n=1 Tax=Pyrocoelia pectoralis TaxID=417401 RepID=A0AAN7VHH1_9COLE